MATTVPVLHLPVKNNVRILLANSEPRQNRPCDAGSKRTTKPDFERGETNSPTVSVRPDSPPQTTPPQVPSEGLKGYWNARFVKCIPART
jgi:hypothetical protein